MWEYIVGAKTVAALDLWSIEHVMSGLSMGHEVKRGIRNHLKHHFPTASTATHIRAAHKLELIGVLCIAYMWETFEHYCETGLFGSKVEYWFQGVEAWSNRMIADPLLLVVGYYIVVRYPQLVVPARIFSIAWLLVHIFVFPHSMYLQDMLFP